MSLVFAASSDSGSGRRSSRFIGPIVRWLVPAISEPALERVVAVVRKAAHVSEYAVLAALLWRARHGMARERVEGAGMNWNIAHARFALVGSALYAVTDEVHQGFVPNRGPSLGDVFLDTAGAALGLCVVWLYCRVRKRWRT
jgi:VanZ family protein